MEIKEIKVICVNPKYSTKLIKGATYLVQSINTNKWYNNERTVYISNVGNYKCENFTLIDGSSLDIIPDFDFKYEEYLDTQKTDYTGQYVKCRSDSGKYIKQNEIYYIENQKKTQKVWNGQTYDVIKLKIRGIDRLVNPNNFTEIPLLDQRSIKLKNIKGQSPQTGDRTRKFLLYSEQKKINIIYQLLSKVLIDINNAISTEQIDIKTSILSKGKTHNIIEDDIIEFLDIIKPTLKSFNLKY